MQLMHTMQPTTATISQKFRDNRMATDKEACPAGIPLVTIFLLFLL